jgi:hypothetical protein
VRQQKAQARAASKATNRQFKSDQSRAKRLRSVHEKAIASTYSKRMGKSPTEVRDTFRSLPPATQIKMIKQFVRDNRKNVRR